MRLAQIIGMMRKEGEIIVDLSEVKLLVLYSIHKRPPFFSLFFCFFPFRKSYISDFRSEIKRKIKTDLAFLVNK